MVYKLHAVIISKDIPFKTAQKKAKEIIKDNNKTFYRKTQDSYRFRNIPKTKFSEFRSKSINKDITLVFGKLKK